MAESKRAGAPEPLRDISEYQYGDAKPTWANVYLWPVVQRVTAKQEWGGGRRRALDLGCGNGATANMLASLGFEVLGVDPSTSGIEHALRLQGDPVRSGKCL
jgi:2-polyprenyl-3-methyl-5-hydroxy-6-metoxy-1,4-benzoquinol methylase